MVWFIIALVIALIGVIALIVGFKGKLIGAVITG